MPIDVFLSVGRTSTADQDRFVLAIDKLLRESGMTACRAQWSSVQPLKKIEEVMAKCYGTVIIAFERNYSESSIERRGSGDEVRHSPFVLPTVWNQIEAALAYSRGHPLLVICDKNMHIEGLLEQRYDWWVQSIPLDEKKIYESDFRGVLDDWKQRVIDYQKNIQAKVDTPVPGLSDPANWTIGQVFLALKPAHLWTILAAIVGAIGAAATLAFFLGQNIPTANQGGQKNSNTTIEQKSILPK